MPLALNDVDDDKKTVLMWAVEKGREVVIDKCFENGTFLEARDNDGWTAVMYAARRGNIEICSKLLNYGANLDVATTEDGFTALHLAAGNGHVLVCVALIEAGANFDKKDVAGKVPFEYLRIAKSRELYEKAVATVNLSGKSAESIHRRRMQDGAERSVSKRSTRFQIL